MKKELIPEFLVLESFLNNSLKKMNIDGLFIYNWEMLNTRRVEIMTNSQLNINILQIVLEKVIRDVRPLSFGGSDLKISSVSIENI